MYLFVKYILPTVEPTIKHNVLFVFKPQSYPKSLHDSQKVYFLLNIWFSESNATFYKTRKIYRKIV